MRPALVFVVLAACGVEDHTSTRAQAVNSRQCAMDVVEGLDVYNGTGTIDWNMVAASGRAFAFIKATQGDYNKQSSFATNWANSATAGMMRSAYHFFDPTIDGVAQANWFLAELAAAGGPTANDLPVMLDIECPVSSSQSVAKSNGPNCEYTGNSGWVATATMQQRIFDWLSTVEAALGRRPVLYSYPSWFPDTMFSDGKLTTYPLFIATYSTCASVPPPWMSAVFWQYSATATVPGIPGSGNVDVDRFFGSAADLQTWNHPPVATDAGVGAEAGVDPMTPPAGGGCCDASSGAGGSSLALAAAVAALGRRRRRS